MSKQMLTKDEMVDKVFKLYILWSERQREAHAAAADARERAAQATEDAVMWEAREAKAAEGAAAAYKAGEALEECCESSTVTINDGEEAS